MKKILDFVGCGLIKSNITYSNYSHCATVRIFNSTYKIWDKICNCRYKDRKNQRTCYLHFAYIHMYLHINIQNVCNPKVVNIMSNILYPLSFIFYQSSTTIPMKGSFIRYE